MKPLAVILVALAAAGPLGALEVARRSGEYPLAEAAPVNVDVAAGQLHFSSYGGDAVAVEMVLTCTGDLYRCQEAAEDVALATSVGDGEPVVWLGGPEEYRRGRRPTDQLTTDELPPPPPVFRTCSVSRVRNVHTHTRTFDLRPHLRAPGWRLGIELGIRYPIDRRLEVRLGEGEAVVNGLRSDADVRVEKGDARLSLNQSDVGSLSLRTRKGTVRLQRRDGRSVPGERWRLRGNKLDWEGQGRLQIEVEVEEGDIVVLLF